MCIRFRKNNDQPLWNIFKDQTADSVGWSKHSPNPRFAVFTCSESGEGMVWDRETGLIWTKNANPVGANNWLDANTLCREFVFCQRTAWRLPRVEELSSLIDKKCNNPALPSGHPFENVQFGAGVPAYWTSTNSENPATPAAWFVNLESGGAGLGNKSIQGFIWPVRGGCGGNNWNW